jgi:hypothetical protein
MIVEISPGLVSGMLTGLSARTITTLDVLIEETVRSISVSPP